MSLPEPLKKIIQNLDDEVIAHMLLDRLVHYAPDKKLEQRKRVIYSEIQESYNKAVSYGETSEEKVISMCAMLEFHAQMLSNLLVNASKVPILEAESLMDLDERRLRDIHIIMQDILLDSLRDKLRRSMREACVDLDNHIKSAGKAHKH